jgi:hypothetical protein
MSKLAITEIGQTVATLAQQSAPAIAYSVARNIAEESPGTPFMTEDEVKKVVEKLTTQDPAIKSTRVWALALPVLSTLAYALLDPSMIAAFVSWLGSHPGALWGVAANFVALVLPAISRMLDKRPIRGTVPTTGQSL